MNLDNVLKRKLTLHPFPGFESCNVIVIVDPAQQGQQNFKYTYYFVTMGYQKKCDGF